MPLTLWGFDWGPVWGGEDVGYSLPAPLPIPENAAVLGSFWLADDSPADTGVTPDQPIASDSIGSAPRYNDNFQLSGFVTLVGMDDGNSGTDLRVVQSDYASSTVQQTVAQTLTHLHAETYGDSAITGAPDARKPAFVGVYDSGSGEVSAVNIPVYDLTTTTADTVVWDNELSADLSSMRLVSLEGKGTVIVIPAASAQNPQDAVYLKSTFGSGNAAPAVEVLVDLRPADGFTVDLSRLHVVGTHNGVILFYYAVEDAQGVQSTAVMGYTPLHAGYDTDLTYSSDGIVRQPEIFEAGKVPIISPKGARRHPVSNDIIVGLEPYDVQEGTEIHWYSTRGIGTLPDESPDVWDAENHPYLFGGKLANVAPDRHIQILSVGWADARQGGSFPLVGRIKFGEIDEGQGTAFVNTYRTDSVGFDEVYRLCLGGLFAPRAGGDAHPGGHNELKSSYVAPVSQVETHRSGFDETREWTFDVRSVIPFDQVINDQAVATKGPNAEVDAFVIPTQGILSGAAYFTSLFASGFVEPESDWDDSGRLFVSCWVFPQERTSVEREEYWIASRQGQNGPVWKLLWRDDGATERHFEFHVTTDDGGSTTYIAESSDLGQMPLDTWYHVAAVFDGTNVELYLHGVLIARAVTGGGDLFEVDTDAYLRIGYGQQAATASIHGRVDDFAFGVDVADPAVRHKEVLLSYHSALVNRTTGPVRSGRAGGEDTLTDPILATATARGPEGAEYWYTVAARKVSMSNEDGISRGLAFDLWECTRQAAAPTYRGVIEPSPILHDGRATPASDTLASPVMEDALESYEMRLMPTPGGEGQQYDLIYTVRQDTSNGASADDGAIMRLRFEVPKTSYGADSHSLVASLSGGQKVTALDAIYLETDGDPDELYTIAAITAGTEITHRLYIINQTQEGAAGLTNGNSKAVPDLMPSTNTRGSYSGRNYTTGFSGQDHAPLIRGIVSREVRPDMGISDQAYGGVQLIVGLQGFDGGTLFAGEPSEQIVGNLHILVPKAAFTGSPVGDFDLYTGVGPTQLDEHLLGGVDPFVPLAWMKNPQNNTGDTYLLGRTGKRLHLPSMAGNDGLVIYGTKQQGFVGLRVLAQVGTQWAHSLSVTQGASAHLSVSASDNLDPVQVWVTQLSMDRTDKFSTMYISEEEAASAGIDLLTTGLSNPVLRRSDRACTVMWSGFRVDLRSLTDRPTGGGIKRGSRFQAYPVLRWSLPGRPFQPVFE